jgi:phosphoglycolate phosphatase
MPILIPEQPFKAVIFDLDGTLINSLQDIADAMNRVLVAHGYPTHPYDAYRTFVGRGLRNLTEQALPLEAKEETIIQTVHTDLLKDYKEHYIRKTDLYPGIANMLNGLKANGMGLAIVSNKAHEITSRIVKQLFAPWPFACVLGTGGDIPRKPDPTGALMCAESLGVKAKNIVYVGDSGIDMQTAHNSGMYPVGVTWGFRSREELEANGAALLIDKPEDLLQLWR